MTKKVQKRTPAPKKPVRRKPKKPKRKVNHLHLWTVILAFVLVLEVIGGIAGVVVLRGMLKDEPVLNTQDFLSPESTHIFDANGTQIADVGTQLRENVSYNEMSEALIDAFIAIEDSRFFDHNGFDSPRFIKSALVNAKNMLTHNSSRQGGSTFTMQLVKLTYFQNEETGVSRQKNLEYKFQQIDLARDLEKEIDKRSIFELYLNKMNFGGTGNIRGIEKASEYYYGKHASELNLAESAMLAGVINSPYWYDPHNYLDYATNRRNTVLQMMLRHGYINRNEYKLALTVNVEDTLVDPLSNLAGGTTYAYQSYIDTVITEVQNLTGQDPYSVAMDIYTYMDPRIQEVVDTIQKDQNPDVVFPDELMECGIVSMDNHTGEIVAIGGGRNYGRGGAMLLNHATQQYKQPGSSVKPIVDYALAFEYLGWATSHVVTDKPIFYEGTDKIVHNAGGNYSGQVTLQYALSMSLNTPAIQTLQEVINKAGWQTVVDYIRSLGFSRVTPENFDIGFAIGGSNFEVSVRELAAAHSIIMNGGNYITPHTVSRIVFRNGEADTVVPSYEAVNVLSEQAAYLTATLMYNVVNDYVYTQPLRRNYAVYAKTGTTDWGEDGLQYNIPRTASKDKWMVCETSKYTTAVWVGYEKGIKDANTYFDQYKSDLNLPGKICNVLLSALCDDLQPEAVPMPSGISYITHLVATFPYTAAPPEANGQYQVTGMIKTDKYSLADYDKAQVESLYEFNADYEPGILHLYWTPYPDEEKLQVADDKMDISLYSGETLVLQATGRRMFDYSWLYGPIRYKARIMQEGVVVDNVVSDSEYMDLDIILAQDTATEVCGYYGYENNDSQSKEVCVAFRTQKPPEPDPTPEPTVEPTPEPTPEETEPPMNEETTEENNEAETG